MQESIWGAINLMVEIALNIYMIHAENGSGIVMPKEKAVQFSEETVKKAVEEDGKLYFESGDPMDSIMSELLEQRLIMTKKVEAECIKLMQQYQKGEKTSYEFSGDPTPPLIEQELQKIRNGIYMPIESSQIYIHKSLAEIFLSPYALEYSKMENDYYGFSDEAIALPLWELRNFFPECKELIIQEDSLAATLTINYPAYVEHMNRVLPDKEKIMAVDAVPNLFLQNQIEKVEIETDQEEEYEFVEMEDFGEQIDYTFEL